MAQQIIKLIRMCCNSCGYDVEYTDDDKRFDEVYNFDSENDVCPGCKKKVIEEI